MFDVYWYIYYHYIYNIIIIYIYIYIYTIYNIIYICTYIYIHRFCYCGSCQSLTVYDHLLSAGNLRVDTAKARKNDEEIRWRPGESISVICNFQFPSLWFIDKIVPESSWVRVQSMAMQQETIYWRYLPYIRPMQGNIPRKYGQTYGTNVPPF